jgi:hypothetical protein
VLTKLKISSPLYGTLKKYIFIEFFCFMKLPIMS